MTTSADVKYLALGSGVGTVKVFDNTTWEELVSIADLTNVAFRVNFTPEAKSLLIANGNGAAVVISMPRIK